MSLKKNPHFSGNSHNQILISQYPDLSDLTLFSILGSGAFGKVLLAKNQETNQELAIKVFSKRFFK